ncbi:MAG: hypothetical protein SNJ63_10075 [Sphingomonadaceae bacterium]
MLKSEELDRLAQASRAFQAEAANALFRLQQFRSQNGRTTPGSPGRSTPTPAGGAAAAGQGVGGHGTGRGAAPARSTRQSPAGRSRSSGDASAGAGPGAAVMLARVAAGVRAAAFVILLTRGWW